MNPSASKKLIETALSWKLQARKAKVDMNAFKKDQVKLEAWKKFAAKRFDWGNKLKLAKIVGLCSK